MLAIDGGDDAAGGAADDGGSALWLRQQAVRQGCLSMLPSMLIWLHVK
jgi:hypothetical protein